MTTCTGCKLTTFLNYDPAMDYTLTSVANNGPTYNITPSASRTLIHNHVVQGVGKEGLSGITGFPLGWINIYLDSSSDGSCIGVTGRLTLPAVTSGQMVTGTSGISFNGSTEYCTGATQGCHSNRLYFEFSGNPDVYKAAPQANILVYSNAVFSMSYAANNFVKYHAISGNNIGLNKDNQNLSGTIIDNFDLACGETARTHLIFEGYIPNVFGLLRSSYYYFINCTTCQTGIGGA
jgi:hypothetical protein